VLLLSQTRCKTTGQLHACDISNSNSNNNSNNHHHSPPPHLHLPNRSRNPHPPHRCRRWKRRVRWPDSGTSNTANNKRYAVCRGKRTSIVCCFGVHCRIGVVGPVMIAVLVNQYIGNRIFVFRYAGIGICVFVWHRRCNSSNPLRPRPWILRKPPAPRRQPPPLQCSTPPPPTTTNPCARSPVRAPISAVPVGSPVCKVECMHRLCVVRLPPASPPPCSSSSSAAPTPGPATYANVMSTLQFCNSSCGFQFRFTGSMHLSLHVCCLCACVCVCVQVSK
jgi:hypothetical protein